MADRHLSLVPGRLLGPYEIVSLLGAGGMGEVYRARDTRLNRTVAIKVLPSTLSADAVLRERFEREARAISALSHPNICALYDIGKDDGTVYLVMEYLEGETLAERIARGPLPSSHVLRFGGQIAEALQGAHRAGITHRDLKPGNIMLTSGGARLLDFGLAKFVEPASQVFSEHSAPATQINPLTAEGTIVGTFQYMSPEQIEGKAVDHRTDIFSLGVILYEMATGRPPFRGDSPVSLIAAILTTDPPPIRSLQPAAPPALERIILTALEKNPDERWQTAQDVGRQLRWISESSLTAEQPAPSRRRNVPLLAVILSTALAAGLLTWIGSRLFGPAPATPASARVQFALPPEIEPSFSVELTGFALSPDGRTIVFKATSGGASSLYLRGLDSFEIRKVEGTEGALSPFWSSDGGWIGFSSRGKLWKMRIAGDGPPEAICEINPTGAHATWQGRTILFADLVGGRREIFRVADDGGAPVKVTSVQPGEWRHTWPCLLPDGKHFLYLSFSAESLERKLLLASLNAPGQSVLVTNVSQARLLGKDRLAYVRDGKLLSQRFDVVKGSTIGEPATIASNVGYLYIFARADFDTSPAGVVVYRTNTSKGRLVQVDRKGIETRIIDDKELYIGNAISPDGKKAAVTLASQATGLADIWVYDLASAVRDRFTSEPGMEFGPAWSPHGRSIVYAQNLGGMQPRLVLRPLDASTPEELIPEGQGQSYPNFSPDGETIFYQQGSVSGLDIFTLAMKTRKSEPFLATGFSELQPEVSPDGQWLAFASNATGISEVYVQSLASGSARIRLSNQGGWIPRWRGDGRELFYVSEDEAVISVVPSALNRWDDATVTKLFRVPDGVIWGFDVSPDGQSFLISTRIAGAADHHLHVVLGLQ